MRKTILSVMIAAAAQGALANDTPQALPLAQNWSDGSMISVADDWTGVPGFIGYLGNIDSVYGATWTNMNPQLILGDDDNGSSSSQDVVPNSTATATAGGVHEIDSDCIALQGSGTADAPFLKVHVATTGLQNIAVAYNLKELDTDNAVQQFSLQFRVGTSGGFADVPAAYVADASNGAGLVTPINVTLPPAANNQPNVTIRWMTTNAGGSDSMVGIDDISITGTPIAGVHDWSVY